MLQVRLEEVLGGRDDKRQDQDSNPGLWAVAGQLHCGLCSAQPEPCPGSLASEDKHSVGKPQGLGQARGEAGWLVEGLALGGTGRAASSPLLSGSLQGCEEL